MALPLTFEVFRVQETRPGVSTRSGEFGAFSRRDYYGIALLVEGSAILTYADRTIPIEKGALMFSNPFMPYTYHQVSAVQVYYSCLFTEQFVGRPPELFNLHGNHVFFADDETAARVADLFLLMLAEAAGDYRNKDDVQRNYLRLLMNEASMLAAPADVYMRTTSADRITELFLELLERQFPVSSPGNRLRLKTAGEFAAQLSLEVNYLHRSVKSVTGKTTSALIAGRVTREAKRLLQETDWDAAEIGRCLGFAHAENFQRFFRRMAGETVGGFRGGGGAAADGAAAGGAGEAVGGPQ